MPSTRPQPTTMLQIAKHLGISQATVSRVLNGKGHEFISPTTRQQVIDAARQLGFDAKRLGVAIEASRHHAVALWIRNPTMSYYAQLLDHLQRCAEADGFAVIVAGYSDRPSDLHLGTDQVPGWNAARWPVDGIIAIDCPQRQQAFLDSRRARTDTRPRIVAAGCEADSRMDHVVFEMFTPSYEGVRTLIRSGRRRILHLTAYYSLTNAREARATGYRRAMEEAGLEPVVITAAEDTRVAAKAAILDYLAKHPNDRFDGVFCLHDVMSLGVYQALRQLGRRVPEDVIILGYGGLPEIELLEPPLCTVQLPSDQLAAEAWRTFRFRLDHPDAPVRRTVIQPKLIIR